MFALTIDSDARLIARRARDEGAVTVAVIASDTPLSSASRARSPPNGYSPAAARR